MSLWKKILIVLAVVFVGIQLVPYGRDHENPAVVQEPNWDSPQTKALAQRACYDCHSNETKWPWYSHVAPVSWLVQHHVEDGRKHLNFSRFDQPQKHAHESAEEIEEGEMPMAGYVLLHGEAKLSDAEKQLLMAGLKAMFPGKGHKKGGDGAAAGAGDGDHKADEDHKHDEGH
ncbi:MAG: heme-binding domain-containing protein [Myxococcales bacterium]|nr:heme-binding domain-containing protein [Myxococcales bacterium]